MTWFHKAFHKAPERHPPEKPKQTTECTCICSGTGEIVVRDPWCQVHQEVTKA
jgi:hypothetical protein